MCGGGSGRGGRAYVYGFKIVQQLRFTSPKLDPEPEPESVPVLVPVAGAGRKSVTGLSRTANTKIFELLQFQFQFFNAHICLVPAQ